MVHQILFNWGHTRIRRFSILRFRVPRGTRQNNYSQTLPCDCRGLLSLHHFPPDNEIVPDELISTYISECFLARCVDINIIWIWRWLRSPVLRRHSRSGMLACVFMYSVRPGPWRGALMTRCALSDSLTDNSR